MGLYTASTPLKLLQHVTSTSSFANQYVHDGSISATFSTILFRVDSFGCWPCEWFSLKQLATHRFIDFVVSDSISQDCRLARFSCRVKFSGAC